MTRVIVRLPVLWLLLAVALASAQPSVAQDVSTPLPVLSLQPAGMLNRLGLAVPIENYRDSVSLPGATDIAVSGDLLFVSATDAEALSVWRLNAEMGTLSQTMFYRDGVGDIDGLDRARGIAVSGDLLFVTAFASDALSVWRVDAEAGALSQIAVYRDDSILNGAFDVAVSDSGDLLFVTAFFSNALSVWRVNAEAGTLSQTVVYQEGEDGINHLSGAHGVVVSGDLLFVTARTESALSVWRINEAQAALTPIVFYRDGSPDGAGNEVGGLREPRGMAVSGNLLFVAASSVDSGALSVWRVNAEAGTLIQTQAVTAVFPDDSPDDSAVERVTLNGAENIAVSDDLLFLTEPDGNALSVWRVNPEAGTLAQTTAIEQGDLGVDGLSQAHGIAVSGDLLFVSGRFGTLSAWQIIHAEVLSEVPTMVRVQSDVPVMQPVAVTVTAYNGTQRIAAQPVTLSPGTSSALAIFPPGTLSPGQWIFTAEANLPEVLDTSAVQTIVRVATLLSLDPLSPYEFEFDALVEALPFSLTARTPIALEARLPFRLIAPQPDAAPFVANFSYPPGTTSFQFSPMSNFDEDILRFRGQWELALQVPIDSFFTVNDSSSRIRIRTFRLVRAALTLAVPEGVVTVGDTFTVTVGVTEGTPEPLPDGTAVNVTLSFRAGDGQELDREELVLTPAMPSDTATFTAPVTSGSFEVARSGQVEETETHRVIVNGASTLVTVEPVDVQLLLEFPLLEFPSSLVAVSSTFPVTVGTAPELPEGSAVRVTVSLAAFTSEPVLLTPSAPTASVLVTAPAVGGEMILRATGDETPDSSGLELNVQPAQLALQVQVIPTVRLQPGLQPGTDMLEREAYILPPQEVYFDRDPEIDGLARVGAMAASSDNRLLFALGQSGGGRSAALSVWRVNAEAGTLSQGEIYRNGGGISGLTVPTDIAVSGDLVFVTSEFDSAISVWRVNAEAGTLSQGEVYRNNIGGVRGLFGINSVTVSGDGELLFVTSRFDNILSVWRVNAEEGTLSQNRRYQNGNLDAAGNEIRSLRGLSTTEVSDDGNLLFVLSTSPDSPTGFGLSVWQINTEEATLVQLEVYRNGNQDNTGRVVGGISNPRSIAVLDNLLFVASFSDNSLSVWRVNAEEGTLAQTGFYTSGNISGARDVAVSGDGKLLFVTAINADSLSVWRVNAQAGTLSQTMVYRDGVGVDRINGLDRASNAVVSDALLFISGEGDNAISAWKINSADVLQGLPTVITVQLNRPVTKEEVVVKVTASNGTNMREAAVTLPPGTSSANVTFPAGDLIPNGRWIFRAQAQPPSALNTELAQIALQVGESLILELQLTGPEEAVTVGQTYTVTVSTTLRDSTDTVPEGTILEGVPVSAGTDSRRISLQPVISSTQLIFTAPTMAGTVTVRAEQTNFQSAGSNILDSVALGTELLVTISALDVQLVLLEFPSGLVAAGGTFPVIVGTASELPEDTAAQVMLSLADFSSEPMMLTPREPTARVLVTAPTAGGAQTLFATGETAAGSRLELDVLAAMETVQVQDQVLLSLRLEPPREVEAGSQFSVTVGTDMPVPAGAEVLVTVTFAGITQTETLSAGETTATVMFMAPGRPTGTLTVAAAGMAADTNALRLTVNPTSASVEVVPVPIALTLDAPGVVDGDSIFTVTVGAEPALPAGTEVMLTVQFGEATGTVTLSSTMASVTFTAPPEGLLELTAEVTRIMQGDPVVAVSDPVPVMVQVTELVTLGLILEAPAEVVARDSFEVTVFAESEVPEGATVTVTVLFDGTESDTMALTPGASSAVFSVTAPGRLAEGLELVTTSVVTVAEPDALQVTVMEASTEVAVIPQSVQLTLAVVPARVNMGEAVTVTAGVSPALLADTTLTVAVFFGASSQQVTLSDRVSSQPVTFTASVAGLLEVRAQAVAVEPFGLVVAASATQTVRVTELVTLGLILEAPAEVVARDSFEVTVFAESEVPEGATVMVTVLFDGTESDMMALTPGASSAVFSVTAPGRLAEGLELVTTSVVTVAEPDALQVTVMEASTEVAVIPQSVQLTLAVVPARVNMGEAVTVTAGVSPALLADTTLTVAVFFGASSQQVTLSDRVSSQPVTFTASVAGLLEVRVQAVAVEPFGLVVAASATQTVQVTELVTLGLILEAPAEVVARDSFEVTVFAESEVPEGATVMVTVLFDGTESDMMALTPGASSAVFSVTAPGRLAEGLELVTTSVVTVAEPDALQVTVMEASTEVAVIPQSVQLTLAVVPARVNMGEAVTVTAGVSPALLADTTLTVAVFFGASSQQVTLSDRVSSQPVTFTASVAGLLEVRVQAVAVEPFGLVVAASATQTVQVTELVTLGLILEAPAEVVARDSFEVTVFAESEVPEGATVMVTVLFDGTESDMMALTPGASSAVFSVTAPGRLAEGLELVTTSVVTVAEPDALQVTVMEASTEVAVIPQSVQLTLAVVPARVNMGEAVTVTAGVSPALLADTTLTVAVFFGASSQQVTLSDRVSSQPVTFTASVAGLLEVRVQAVAVEPFGLVVAASATQTVRVTELVTLGLILEAPAEVVARDSFEVTVFAESEVPEGATVMVTVLFDGTESDTMALTPGASSAVFSVTAPGRLAEGLELVTTSVVTVAEPDALQVTVMEASTEVAVIPQSVQLTLAVVPARVNMGEAVTVTAGVSPALLADTTLTVAVFFGASSQQVTLSDRVSSQPVTFTASVAGLLEVRVQAVAVEPFGLVVAASATQTVQVTELVTLGLILEAPAEVVARDSFEVTVFAESEVPEGATVTVTVLFDGTESDMMALTPGASSAVFSVTAPGRLAEGLELVTTSVVTVAEPDALQVTVMEASTEVAVIPQSVQLTLAVVPARVNMGEAVTVTAGVSPALLADTTLTVAVFFGASSQQVTLSDRVSSQPVTFTASVAGLLEVRVQAVAWSRLVWWLRRRRRRRCG